ncbi:FecR family protein [Dawidia soli]|uniref:FecR domain-containing protein n=1 Tax=Dawidia soli TaxID=2782352 RepID=A0AAP2DBS1_9BACT|nr:FecR domain-containing protein [Dawidia soli]MBT1689054.1 FecR domain-containing protein [Dawidia soli]
MENITPELLEKYFKGLCTPDEAALVMQALAGKHAPAPLPDDHDVFRGVDKRALQNEIWKQVQPPAQPKRAIHRRLPLQIAASLLLIAAAMGILYQYRSAFVAADTPPALAASRVIQAARGEKIRLTLPDGTIVHLNSGSTLTIPEKFTDTARIVHLSGEAYLEVARDASRPFSVLTSRTTVRVLGTVFRVKAYPDEASTTVTVEEGKVRVSDAAGYHVLLTRDQGVTCLPNGKPLTVQSVYAANYTAWRHGTLIFKDESLSEVAAILARWYNIPVLIQNKKIATHRFTGRFTNNPALATVLKELSTVMQCQYELNDKRLILY